MIRFAAFCAAMTCLLGAAWAQAPSAASFVADPSLRSVTLSPSGEHVAYIRDVEAAEQLIVVDLATMQGRVVEQADRVNNELSWVAWKSDDRLILGVVYNTVTLGSGSTGTRVPAGAFGFAVSRVFAIGHDGSNSVQLFADQARQLARGMGSTFLLDPLPAEPNHVLLMATDNRGVGAWRANLSTGRVERIADGDYDTMRYVTDGAGYPVIRMDEIGDRSGYRILRRASGESGWTTFRDVRRVALATNSPDFIVVGSGPAANQVYVLARPDDRDLLALYLFDTRTGQLGAPLQEGREADVGMPWIHPTTREVFVRCEYVQRLQCTAAERSVDRHLSAVEAFLGADVSARLVNMSADAGVWLLYATGPTESGAYYLYDRAQASVRPLAAVFPDTPAQSRSPMRIVSYRASDGASLWAYVTAPAGDGPKPMVVMPHGGPEMRDFFEYDAFVQFLASRGYVVVQPNFRGSLGFGRAFGDAGRGQWGRRMQDDVTDAVRHMIATGVADPERICMVGASYGGYVALAGVTLTPDLYQCAISIAGVSDLVAMLRTEREEGSRSSSYQYWIRSIGDPSENRDALAVLSPARLADRVTAPVLLVHGTRDRTVLFNQSELMRDALVRAGKPTRLIELDDAGHTWSSWSQEQRAMLFEETEAFLAEHLSPARP